MAATRHVVDSADPDAAVPSSTLDLPETWRTVPDPGPALAAFTDGRTLSPAVETNLVLTATALQDGATLASWQDTVTAQRLAALPDLQVLDERDAQAPDGGRLRCSSAVMTDPHGVTLLTRRWCWVVGAAGLTLTLTTLPLVDVEHGDLLDAIAASWALGPVPTEETPDARS